VVEKIASAFRKSKNWTKRAWNKISKINFIAFCVPPALTIIALFIFFNDMDYELKIAIVALVCSILIPFLKSVLSKREKNNTSSKNTIYYFNDLRREYRDIIEAMRCFYNKKDRSWEYEAFIKFLEKHNEKEPIKEATVLQLLSALERFSVGINNCVFDLETTSRLSGTWLVKTFELFETFIKKRRKERGDEKRGKNDPPSIIEFDLGNELSTSYIEFERACEKIKALIDKEKKSAEEIKAMKRKYDHILNNLRSEYGEEHSTFKKRKSKYTTKLKRKNSKRKKQSIDCP